MPSLTILSEVLLYTSFSLLFGFYIIHLVPEQKRTKIVFPKWLRILCIVSIAVFPLVPIVQLVLYVSGGMDVFPVLTSIVTTFEIGKAWLYMLGFVFLLLFQNLIPDIEKKKPFVIISLVYLIGLVLLVGWSSHASSLSGWKGFFLHSLHFAAISSWAGILLIIGWFTKETQNDWLQPFLRWFTPFAIGCVVVGITTGILIMQLVVEFKDYAQSWLVPYGQALLFKHLFIIPLLVFAFINGFLIKRLIKKENDVKVLSWLKAEGIIIFFIFIFTGILGQQSPPHDIASAIAVEGPSKLIEMFYPGQISAFLMVTLSFQPKSIIMASFACICLLLMIFLFLRKKSSYLALLFGSLFVISSYISLMLSVQ
jgi:putative copper export protein